MAFIKLPEGAAPSTPASGTVVAYAKADGYLYSKDDVGTETQLGGGGGTGDVVGPASATNNSLARFDGTTGKLLKDGAVIGTDVQAYDADIPTVAASQGEMEAGTEAALRSMSPLRVAQAIAALGGSFDPASPGAIGGTTPAAITATTLKHTGAMDSQAVRYAGDATYHREAEITKTFNPGSSAAIDVATCILGDNYSVAYVTVEAVGVGGSGGVVAVRAVRRVAMVGDSPSFTTIGTDDTSNASISFSYVATHGFKATITNGIAQQIYGGMKMSVVGGGADGVDGGITSLT